MDNTYDGVFRYIADELEKMAEALEGMRCELEKPEQDTEPLEDGE